MPSYTFLITDKSFHLLNEIKYRGEFSSSLILFSFIICVWVFGVLNYVVGLTSVDYWQKHPSLIKFCYYYLIQY